MMKLDNIIETLINRLEGQFEGDKTGHDFAHLRRTLNYGLYLWEREGGDAEVIATACLVHDVHRILTAREGRFVHPRESLDEVRGLIGDLQLSEKQIQHVLYAVEHHEQYAFGKEKVTVKDIESKIVQDADNLDAIGAIAVIRSFRYGSAHKMPDYLPEEPFYFSEYGEDTNDKSTIHHLYNKSLRLGKFLNTVSARKLARKKTKVLKDFIELYVQEYTGNFEE